MMTWKKAAREYALANLKVTDQSQLVWTADDQLIYRPKPDDARRANSRDGYCVHRKDGCYDKFCENCGAKMVAIAHERRLCDRCHDEICVMLHVDYSVTRPYTHKRHGRPRKTEVA